MEDFSTELASILGTDTGSEPVTGGEAYLQRIKRAESYRNAHLLMLSGDDPAILGEAVQISKRTGYHPELILGDMDRYREELEIIDTADAMYGAPALSKWINDDPLNLGLAKGEVDNLAGIERFLQSQFGLGLQQGVETAKLIGTSALSAPVQSIQLDLAGTVTDLATASAMWAEIAAREGVNPLEAGLLDIPQGASAWREISDELGLDVRTPRGQAIYKALVYPEQRQSILEEVTQQLASTEGVVDQLGLAMEQFRRNMLETQGRTPNFTDIDDIASFADWLAYSTGQAVPLLAAGIAASLTGGTAGTLAFGYTMGVGDVNAEMLEQGINDPAVAFLAGIPYAALERIGAPPQVAAALRGVAPPVLQSAFKRWAVRKGVQVSKAAFGEFVNEAGQAVIADYAVDFAGGEEVILDTEQFLSWFNEGMAGAAGGASISVFTPAPPAGDAPAAPEASEPRPVPPAPPRPSPEQAVRYQNAGTTAETLGRLDSLAQASNTRTVAPERFEELITGITSGETSIYVPAEDLREYAQSAGINVADLGVDRAELSVAATTGNMVAVPIERYLTRVTGTDAAAWFAENAVLDPTREMSLAEQRRDGERILAEAREEVAKIQGQLDQLAEGEGRIYETVRSQLVEAGRTPEVASSEATFFTAFFRSMASRYGGDAYALFERFAVRVQEGRDGPVDGAVELAQGRQQVEVDGIPLDLNADGTVTLYHGTTTDGAAGIRADGMLRSAAEPSVYLTTDPTAAPGYGDGTVVAVNVDPSLLRIDDEFPGGRADFAIDAPEVVVTFPVTTLEQEGLPLFDTPLPIEGRVTVRAIGEALTEAHMQAYGRRLFPEDSTEDYAEVLRVAREELAVQLAQPNSGHGWYSKDVDLAMQQTARILPGLDTPEGRAVFLTFAGIYSNGLDPQQAWQVSIEAYEAFQATGEIVINRADAARAVGREPPMTTYKDTDGKRVTKEAGWGPRNPANEQQLKMFKTLIEQAGGPVAALDWLVNPQPREAINQLMADAGVKTPRFKTKTEREGPPTYGALIFSEKLGRYTLGLHGVPVGNEDTTVDLWYTRTYRRWTGRLLDKPVGKEGVAAQPDPARGGIERQTIFRLTGDLMQDYPELTAGDVQAMLWFFEKRLWGAQGLRTDEGTNSAGARQALERRGLEFDERGGSGAARAEGGADVTFEQATLDAGGTGSYSGGGLAPLEGAPNVVGASGPDPNLVAVAEQYAARNGIDLRRQSEFVEVDPERAARIAQAYEAMEHAPQDPVVQEAYQNLIAQTIAQYQALVDAGYSFTFFDSATDPYDGNPWNAMRDLRANKTMAVYGTYDGYGTEGLTDSAVEDNPMLQDTGLVWPDQNGVERPVTANDLFRAVHDAFGHGIEGAGFRARGEENAWQAHVRLFTGSAVAAITSETRGQNSWLNYGPYGEQNRTAGVEDTVFAEQKTGLMPEWTWTEGRAEDAPTQEQIDEQPTTLLEQGVDPTPAQLSAAGRGRGAEAGTDERGAAATRGDAQQRVSPDDLTLLETLEGAQEFFARPGWGMVTATTALPDTEFYRNQRERNPALFALSERRQADRNAQENARLQQQLEAQGIPYVVLEGMYKGEPDGISFLIFADESVVSELGRGYQQESVLTSNGLIFTQRPQPNVRPTGEVQVGAEARAQEFFSVLPFGQTVTMGLDFGRSGPGVAQIPPGYTVDPTRPQLPVRPDGLVELYHWSGEARKVIDPAFAGTGPLQGEERSRGARLAFYGVNPRANARTQGTGYVKESGLGPVQHVAFVDPQRLYPWFEDPDGLVAGKNISEAEAAIREAGYLGYYITDDGSGAAPLGNVAALFDAVPVQVVPPFEAASGRSGPRNLNQDDSTKGPRGNIQIPARGIDRGTTVINLFEGRDLSTLIHESGHYFYEVFSVLASEADAPRQMKDDLAKLQAWMGVEPGATPSTEAHEKMARGMERYVMEGKAPSAELASVFGRFRAWLTQIYRTVRGLNVQLDDEVRAVFDRMLATDEEIQQVQADMAMSPLFAAAPAGMSEPAWDTYQRIAQEREEKAKSTLLARKMAEIRKRREAWWKEERAAQVQAAMDRLAGDRVYRAIEMLANGRWLGEEGEGAEIPDVRIDRGELVEIFGEDVLQDLAPARFGMSKAIYTTAKHPDGISPQEAAELFGFRDAQDMVDQLRQAGSRKAVAEAEADRLMASRYPDVMDDADMRAEALDAAHSDAQAEMTLLELRHITDQRGGDARRAARSQTLRGFQLRARAMIGQMRVQHAVKPDSFLQAERRAAKAAERAFAKAAKGGAGAQQALAEAQQAKEQQLLNQYLYREARELQALVDRKRAEMRKMVTSPDMRKKIGSPHIEQIEAILEDYEFRGRSQKAIDRTQAYAEYVAQMEADGRVAELRVNPELLAEARRKHYTRLTADEIRAVFDAVDNIAHIGRRTREVVTARRKRLLAESADRVAGQIRRNQKAKDNPRSGVAKGFVNLLSRIDTIAVRMDGGEEFGAFHDEIKRDIDEAQVEEQRRTVEAMGRLEQIFLSHFSRAELKALGKKKSVNGRLWSREQIITMALNTGTESNYQRLLDPRVPDKQRLTTQELDALLATLDERDWRFVQDVWDFNESFWPELAEVEQRRTGVRPKKVAGKPMWPGAPAFVKGGYHRLFYDSAQSGKAAADEEQRSLYEGMSAGWGAKAQVGNGMTVARMENANGRPVLLEFSTIPRAMRETVRLITLSEAVDATDRILRTAAVRTAMEDTGNLDTLNTLNLWLRDVAAGPIYNTDVVNRAARLLKNNFTLARLAFNMKTVVLQVTGLSQASVTIGHKNMVVGLAKYARRPVETQRAILAKSPFMQERQTTFQKDVYDFRNSQKVASPVLTGASRGMDLISKAGFWPIVAMQFNVVDVPVWLGAYEGALAEGKSEQDAVYVADRMVARSQDSGLMADRSAVERGTLNANTRQADFVRMFTTLGGYMLTKMNRANVEILRRSMQIREADSPGLRVALALRLASDLIILYAFEAAAIGLMYSWLTDEDEPEDLRDLIIKETGFAVVGGVPFIKDAANAFLGFDAGGVYGTGMGSFGKAYTQWAQGEVDDSALRATLDLIGTGTGLPTTATYRILEQFLGDDEPSVAEALFGSNPLTR